MRLAYFHARSMADIAAAIAVGVWHLIRPAAEVTNRQWTEDPW